jgi:hypothetical protein
MAKEDSKQRIIETLRKEGFIDNMRAKLRAQVVQTLEAEKKASLGSAGKYIKPLSLSTTRKVIANEDGLLCAELIREFLSFFQMEHTLGVFVPEMSLASDFPKSRNEMAAQCGFSKSQDDESKPLILRLIEKVRIGDFGAAQIHVSGKRDSNDNTEEISHSPDQMRP